MKLYSFTKLKNNFTLYLKAGVFTLLFENGRSENTKISNDDFGIAVKSIIQSTSDLNTLGELKPKDVQIIQSELIKKLPSAETEINQLSNVFEKYLEPITSDDKVGLIK